jgi:hypothetical protein
VGDFHSENTPLCTLEAYFVFRTSKSAINFIEKVLFPYENATFSSSIRSAADE